MRGARLGSGAGSSGAIAVVAAAADFTASHDGRARFT
jgi:hypothetical protein